MTNTPSFKVESVTAANAVEQQVANIRYDEKNKAVNLIKSVITSVYGIEDITTEAGNTVYHSPEANAQTVQQTTSNVNNPLFVEQARLATAEAFRDQESINNG
jgi:hypothetical protein